MKFSIIIVTSNKHKELFNCLESISCNQIQWPYEVIVVFNGDRSYMERCSQTFTNISLFFINKTTSASARNFGITKINSEFILFLNDDCRLPIDYFTLINFENNWDVLGGLDLTPLKSTPFQQTIGKVLISPLCTGFNYTRHTLKGGYQENAHESLLSLSNLWIKASLFTQERYKFNSKVFNNEDILLLKQFKNKNKVFHYSPNLFVFHERKKNLEELGTEIIRRGKSRMQSIAIMPQKKDAYYFLPIIGLIILSWIIFHPQSVITNVFIIYTFFVSLYYAIKYRSFNLTFIFLHFFVLGSYAIGLLIGLWKFHSTLYNNLRENKSFIRESKIK